MTEKAMYDFSFCFRQFIGQLRMYLLSGRMATRLKSPEREILNKMAKNRGGMHEPGISFHRWSRHFSRRDR